MLMPYFHMDVRTYVKIFFHILSIGLPGQARALSCNTTLVYFCALLYLNLKQSKKVNTGTSHPETCSWGGKLNFSPCITKTSVTHAYGLFYWTTTVKFNLLVLQNAILNILVVVLRINFFILFYFQSNPRMYNCQQISL